MAISTDVPKPPASSRHPHPAVIMRTAVAPPTEPAAAAAAAPRQLAACSSAMIPISRLKIINLRDRHIASEQRVMVKKRKYIKSGKVSKKNKGLETESCQQYAPIRGKTVFKVSVLKLTIDFIASSTSSTVQQESSNSQSFESPLSNRVDQPRVIVKTKLKVGRPKKGCPHGRQRSKCKDCEGKGICEHGRRRSLCKDCGGKDGAD